MNVGEQSIVADWLRTLGLPQYAESFVDNGYDDLEICKQIGEPDLDAIGVTDPKHRDRVLQAVRVLLEQGGTAVYFTLEEAARHSRFATEAEYGFGGDWGSATDKASSVVRPDSLRYFADEYEEGKAELVRFPKMQLKIIVREKIVRDGIRLSMQPYSNPVSHTRRFQRVPRWTFLRRARRGSPISVPSKTSAVRRTRNRAGARLIDALPVFLFAAVIARLFFCPVCVRLGDGFVRCFSLFIVSVSCDEQNSCGMNRACLCASWFFDLDLAA